MVIKYAIVASMVALGIFAFSKRQTVLDAFDWDPHAEGIPVPAFDPVARTKELTQPPPAADAIRVAQAADTRSVDLTGVPAPTVAPISLTGGTATLAGVVTGPDGPVPGATVRIERFVGSDVGTVELTTTASGAFTLPGAQGGRYRVRAWRAPSLAQPSSDVSFVADGEQRSYNLALDAPSGRAIDLDWSYSGWVLGGTPWVSVSVAEPYVNSNGQVALHGAAGLPVTVSVGGALSGSSSGTTDSSGSARFTLLCAGAGSTSATLTVGGTVRTLDIPSCLPPPTTTTTTTTSTTTSSASGSSTTTTRSAGTTTTSGR